MIEFDKTKFNKSYEIEASGCWNWIRSISRGFGIHFQNGKSYRAHRVSWAIYHGDIPPGAVVYHKCDNSKCVNPSHLFIDTPGVKYSQAKLTNKDIMNR